MKNPADRVLGANQYIKWYVFKENTSESDALIDFAAGGSFSEFCRNIYSVDAKIELNKLKKLGVEKARKRAKAKVNSYWFGYDCLH